MDAHRRLSAALASALCLGAGVARAGEPLTLGEAVHRALVQNERALKAPLRVEAAQGALQRARGAFLPNLSASGTGSADRNSARGSAGPWNANGALTLSQPLFDLPSYPLYAEARHGLEVERWGAVQDTRLLAFDTARAFLVVLSAEHLLAAAQDKLSRARATLTDAQARVQAQLSGSNDVTLAQVDAASAASNVALAQGAVTRAYVQLGYLLGAPVTPPLQAPEPTVHAAESAVFDAADVGRLAEERRPDVRAAAEHTLALREAAREPLFRLAPSLALQGQLRAVSSPVSGVSPLDESAQLTLSWSLYDAGLRYADRRARLAQAESVALDERALRRSIAADIANALASLEAEREAWRAAVEGLEAARRHTAEVDVLYKQGLARGLDVVDANGRRYDAEVALESARLSMEQAYLDLRLAVGLDPLEDAAPAPAPGGAR